MSDDQTEAVRRDRQGDVLLLVIDNPPVNALNHAVRVGLAAGLALAVADPSIRAVVLRAEGRSFSTGADIHEFGQPAQPPHLGDLCLSIEALGKPVISALQGTALGGGLELALASHYRIALATARVGLPEVHLGLLPGAGGTQRLPRLIGAEQALRLMLDGRPVGAAEALAMGLIDGVVEDGLEAAALGLAREVAGQTAVPTAQRRDGLRDPLAYQAAVAVARTTTGGRLPAPGRIVDCVEAALLLPLEQGLAFEQAAFAELVSSPESASLRYLFFAERRAARMAEAQTVALPLRTAGVLGTGEAAADWTLALLRAGLTVTLAGSERAGLVAALERIAARQEASVQAGGLTAEARDADWARLKPSLDGAALAGLDIAFEAGEGPMVALIGDTPLVLRLLPSPGEGRLAELEVPPGLAAQPVATLLALLRRVGRVAVRSAGGPVGPRVTAAGRQAVSYLLAQGVAANSVRAALDRFGLAGLTEASGPGTGLPAERIVARCLGAMANAAVRLLERGIVERPSDVDVAMVLGQGFPAWEGGPMLWADRRGLLVLRRDLRLWSAEEAQGAAGLWQPAGLFDALIRDGRSLASLNG